MARLAHLLPPFASDYVGACSALFAGDCLAVIVDASCCTRTYVEYDESRWDECHSGALSAQLRHIEAITGDDRRIVEQACDIVWRYRPGFFALVGTPVPALVGLDLDGIAREVGRETGTACLAVSTTGFATYERGMGRAIERLVGRFALGGNARRDAGDAAGRDHTGADRPLRVNVFGTNPLDVAGLPTGGVERELASRRWQVVCNVPEAYDRSSLALAPTADATLVTSVAGLPAARLLERERGIPFACAFPFGVYGADRAARKLACAAGRPGREGAGPGPDGGAPAGEPAVLVVGDQVVADSLRGALVEGGIDAPVAVGTFFSRDGAPIGACDVAFRGEADLGEWLEAHPRCALVGDPLLERLPQARDRPFVPWVHPAVSSRLFRDRAPTPLGAEGQAWVEEVCGAVCRTADRAQDALPTRL